MASPDVHILELTPHEPVDHQTSYIRDLLRWRSTAPESNITCNISFRDRKLIHPSQSQKAEGTSTSNAFPTSHAFDSFKEPSTLYPIRAEVATQPDHHGPLHRLDSYQLPVHACEYTATVEISGRSFRVQIDTDTSTCWVFGDNYRSFKPKDVPQTDIKTTVALDQTQIPSHTSYIPGSYAQCHGSSRFKAMHSDGSYSSGPIYTDLWKFPTLTGSPLSVSLIFGAAIEVHHSLDLGPFDGVLGLNFLLPLFGIFDKAQPYSIPVTLLGNRLTKNYIFCICMSNKGPSFLSLGGIPPNMPKPRCWIPVIPDSERWLLPCHAFGWGVCPTEKGFQELTIKPCIEVLVDTGTTLCYFTEEVLDFVYPKLGGKKMKIEGKSREEYLVPNKQPLDAARKSIWIKLGDTWVRWSMEIFYGVLKEDTITGTEWYHPRLLPNTDLEIQYSILGTGFLEHINVYFNADINAPKVAFEERP